MGLSILFIILPIRSCINRLIDQDAALENDKEYVSLINAFPTDYDKENPLTAKAGKLRMLDIQIQKA